MSTDELLHQFDDLGFTVEEQDIIYASPVVSDIAANDPSFSMVGRVFTTADVDGAALIRVFRVVWKHEKVLSITKLRYIFFLIRLASKTVRAEIFKRGPWVSNDDWFSLLPLNPMLSIDEYHFNRMVIWVRILRVPIGLMNEALARSLGACIGLVVGTDTRVIDGNMGEFLRVRLSLDVTKPLRRCVALGGCGNKPKLCPLQYEKLPNFCHGCGFVGHLIQACSTHVYSPTSKYQYADWLRAPVKKRYEATIQPKGRILFHEEGGSSNSHRIYYFGSSFQSPMDAAALDAASPVLAAAPVTVDDEKDVLVHGGAAVVDIVSGDVLAVDTMGKVHVSDHGILGDENDVLVTHSSNLEIASVKVVSNFETIVEWFAEDDESTVPVVVEPQLQIPAKRSSGGADSSEYRYSCLSTDMHYTRKVVMVGKCLQRLQIIPNGHQWLETQLTPPSIKERLMLP
ncbi:hypothetical protein GQ457_18G012880 [Hibiscus cannabinus]